MKYIAGKKRNTSRQEVTSLAGGYSSILGEGDVRGAAMKCFYKTVLMFLSGKGLLDTSSSGCMV